MDIRLPPTYRIRLDFQAAYVIYETRINQLFKEEHVFRFGLKRVYSGHICKEMAKLPLVPQWNIKNGCVCTPDGFLYVGSRSINFISANEEATKFKVFHTRQNILSIDIDPHWGKLPKERCNEPNNEEPSPKLFVVLSQDNSVQIWDFNRGCSLQGHKAHLACMRYMEGNGPAPKHAGDVFVSYMINRNVLSVDNQDIVVYCVASNSFYRRPMFVSSRNHQLTTMKCSPYNESHFALGTSRGLVLLCDLQKMVTLYTLRGHDNTVISLSWQRINPTNNKEEVQIPTKPVQKNLKLVRTDTNIIDADDIFDIYDYDYLDNEFGATPQDQKNKSDPISEFVGIEKSKDSTGAAAEFDFAEACQSLKEEINALREEQTQLPEHVVSLEDCKNAGVHDDTSSYGSGSENEDENCRSERKSSDGSLVRLVCGSSEESVDVDGIDRIAKQQLVCQAEVHTAEHKPDVSKEIPCPTQHIPENVDVTNINNDSIDDILLASMSIDGSFYIWNASTGATCDHHKVHGPPHGNKNKKSENNMK